MHVGVFFLQTVRIGQQSVMQQSCGREKEKLKGEINRKEREVAKGAQRGSRQREEDF